MNHQAKDDVSVIDLRNWAIRNIVVSKKPYTMLHQDRDNSPARLAHFQSHMPGGETMVCSGAILADSET